MNAILFFTHLVVLILFVAYAHRLGKEGLMITFALQVITANLFVTKQMTLFGFEITCCDAFIISSMLTLQLLQEFHGREAAQRTVWLTFFGMLFFATMAKIHIAYMPSAHDTTHGAFSTILTSNFRILTASFITFLIVQYFDISCFSYLKKKLPTTHFSLRSSLILIPGQILDTCLFSFLALYGLVANLGAILIVSLLIKMLIISIMSPLTLLARRVHAL